MSGSDGLILHGGGASMLIFYVGMFGALGYDFFNLPCDIVCSSAGAIAVAACMHFTLDSEKKKRTTQKCTPKNNSFTKRANMKKIFSIVNVNTSVDTIIECIMNGRMYPFSHEILDDFMNDFFTDTKMVDMTMADVKVITGRSIGVVVSQTCQRTGKRRGVIIDDRTSPNARFIDAVKASMSIPALFEPRKLKNICGSGKKNNDKDEEDLSYYEDGDLVIQEVTGDFRNFTRIRVRNSLFGNPNALIETPVPFLTNIIKTVMVLIGQTSGGNDEDEQKNTTTTTTTTTTTPTNTTLTLYIESLKVSLFVFSIEEMNSILAHARSSVDAWRIDKKTRVALHIKKKKKLQKQQQQDDDHGGVVVPTVPA